jgi:hypothetical protein
LNNENSCTYSLSCISYIYSFKVRYFRKLAFVLPKNSFEVAISGEKVWSTLEEGFLLWKRAGRVRKKILCCLFRFIAAFPLRAGNSQYMPLTQRLQAMQVDKYVSR